MAPASNGDRAFVASFALIGGLYVGLIVAMIVADLSFTTPGHLLDTLRKPEIRFSIVLSLASCTLTAILSLWVAVPLGYLLSRTQFRGKGALDVVLDVPIVLPPLVIGLSLLILFHSGPGQRFQDLVNGISYKIPAVVLAQFAVSAAFAVRTMRVTFDQISPRAERVAMTLGCSRSQAFWLVLMPAARRGALTAFTLSWARSLGEFGPILVFAGATRFRTEVLPTTVFLELSIGNLEGALAVSLLMIAVAIGVLVLMRTLGLRGAGAV